MICEYLSPNFMSSDTKLINMYIKEAATDILINQQEYNFIHHYVLAVRNEFWNRYKSQSTHHIDSLIEQEQKVIKKAVEVYMNFKRGKINDGDDDEFDHGVHSQQFFNHCSLLKNISLLLEVGVNGNMKGTNPIDKTTAKDKEASLKIMTIDDGHNNKFRFDNTTNPTNDETILKDKEAALTLMSIDDDRNNKISFDNISNPTNETMIQQKMNFNFHCECGMPFETSEYRFEHRKQCKLWYENPNLKFLNKAPNCKLPLSNEEEYSSSPLKKRRYNEIVNSNNFQFNYQNFCENLSKDLWDADNLSGLSDDSNRSYSSLVSLNSSKISSPSSSKSSSKSKSKESYYSVNNDNIVHTKREVKVSSLFLNSSYIHL